MQINKLGWVWVAISILILSSLHSDKVDKQETTEIMLFWSFPCIFAIYDQILCDPSSGLSHFGGNMILMLLH